MLLASNNPGGTGTPTHAHTDTRHRDTYYGDNHHRDTNHMDTYPERVGHIQSTAEPPIPNPERERTEEVGGQESAQEAGGATRKRERETY